MSGKEKSWNTSVLIDKVLEKLSKSRYHDFLESNEKWLVKVGFWGIYLFGFLSAIIAIRLSVKNYMSGWQATCVVFGSLIGAVAMHYVAYKMLPIIGGLVKNTTGQVSSYGLFAICSLVTLIGSVASFIGGIIIGIVSGSIIPFLGGIFVSIFLEYWTALFMRPETVNIQKVEKASLSNECIGIFFFFVNSFMRLVPIIFGSWIIFGCIIAIDMVFSKYIYPYGMIQTISYFGAAILPLGAYVLYLLCCFWLDVLRTLLTIPQLLEKIANKK